MPISSIARHMIIYAVIALAVLTSAHAREKSDIIVLKNGNNINGEIQKLFRGILTVTTDSMGTVEIKWEDVEQVTSKYTFSVEDTYGRLYVGALQPAANPR